MKLARRKRQWPTWSLPSERGQMTAVEVMLAPAGTERDEAIDAWCASVWQAFHVHRDAVVSLLGEYGVD
jgi:hypothetical protein